MKKQVIAVNFMRVDAADHPVLTRLQRWHVFSFLDSSGEPQLLARHPLMRQIVGDFSGTVEEIEYCCAEKGITPAFFIDPEGFLYTMDVLKEYVRLERDLAFSK